MNLIIDIGNTIAKIALFKDNTIFKLFYSSNKYLEGFETILSSYPISQAIVATVIDLTPEIEEQLNSIPVPLLRLNHTTLLPITNLYKSPETLGYDRIASVVAAQEIYPATDVLVVDAGTCITYEFLDSEGQYHGGNISPGVNMRLKALNHYTSRLPLVEWGTYSKMMGEDTESAILSGVRKGIEYEILGYIKELQQKYPNLLVFLTGGDEFSFDTNLKNIIFADRFLVLKGLNRILNYNNDKD